MKRTWKPTTAGILSIIAGAIGIGRGIFVLILGGLIGTLGGLATGEWRSLIQEWTEIMVPGMTSVPEIITGALGIASTFVIALGAISLAFGIVALIGGIYAIRRRVWGLALAGAILSIPSAALLGVLSIIFVSLGRDEFTSSQTG